MRFEQRQAIVSAVIPCFNEEAAIANVVRDCLECGLDEVVVVDGGSSDRTAERAMEAGARVVQEPRRGYGRACAAGVAALRQDCEIVVFLDGDGSDNPAFARPIIAPVAEGKVDFVMGSRLRGRREPGSLSAQQIAAGRVAGLLMGVAYRVRFSDMSPFRAIRRDTLMRLGMRETTYGWNLEMQMRATAAGLRILEIPVDCRRRRGGVSKVSGNARAGLAAAIVIAATFVRLAFALRFGRTTNVAASDSLARLSREP